MSTASRLVVTLIGAVLITGCAARSVHISDLKYRPERYTNKTVSVTGVVTSSVGVPIVGFYKVDDGTGEITVLSRGGAPRKGARVRVKGRVNEVATFGGSAVGLHIEERDRKVRGRI